MNILCEHKIDEKMLCSHHHKIADDVINDLSVVKEIDTLEISHQIADYEELDVYIKKRSSYSIFAGVATLCTFALLFLARNMVFFRNITKKLRDQIKSFAVNTNNYFMQNSAKILKHILPPIINRMVNQAITYVFGDENRTITQASQREISGSQATSVGQLGSNSSTSSIPFCGKGNAQRLSLGKNLTLRKIERLNSKIGVLINEIEYFSEGAAHYNYSSEWLDLSAPLDRSRQQISDSQKAELLRVAKKCKKNFSDYIREINSKAILH